MTEAEAQEILNTTYEGDNSTPSSTGNEYLARRILLNMGVALWEKDTQWNELFVKLSDASDGDKTTTANQASYDCPSDFKFSLGFLWIGTTKYELIPISDFTLTPADNTSKYVYYISGNKNTGFDINFPFQKPTSTGDTIRYEYYKEATTLTATSTVFEMSDPYFAIYYALSKKFKDDGKSSDSREAFVEAQSRLEKMRELNETPGFYQENSIQDRQFAQGGGGFGK